MAYINVALSNGGAESQYTTGKVTLVKEHIPLPLYSVYDDEKKLSIPLTLSKCGHYELIIHLFSNSNSKDVGIVLSHYKSEVMNISFNSFKAINKSSETGNYWHRAKVTLFCRRTATIIFKSYSSTDIPVECEFFIDVHCKS